MLASTSYLSITKKSITASKSYTSTPDAIIPPQNPFSLADIRYVNKITISLSDEVPDRHSAYKAAEKILLDKVLIFN